MEKLLEVKNLKTYFTLKSEKFGAKPEVVKAVNDLSLKLIKGRFLG